MNIQVFNEDIVLAEIKWPLKHHDYMGNYALDQNNKKIVTGKSEDISLLIHQTTVFSLDDILSLKNDDLFYYKIDFKTHKILDTQNNFIFLIRGYDDLERRLLTLDILNSRAKIINAYSHFMLFKDY